MKSLLPKLPNLPFSQIRTNSNFYSVGNLTILRFKLYYNLCFIGLSVANFKLLIIVCKMYSMCINRPFLQCYQSDNSLFTSTQTISMLSKLPFPWKRTNSNFYNVANLTILRFKLIMKCLLLVSIFSDRTIKNSCLFTFCMEFPEI